MKKVLVLILGVIFFSSCGSAFHAGSRTVKKLEVFQVLENKNTFSRCLARDSDLSVFCVVSVPLDKKPKMFYDDLTLVGDFTVVGTYTYETKTRYTYETKDGYKTVPVLFYTKDCKKYSKEELRSIISLFCN
jgi:hypothetical protein